MFIISASISSIEFRLGEISITRPLLTVRGGGGEGGGVIVQFHSIELMNAATQATAIQPYSFSVFPRLRARSSSSRRRLLVTRHLCGTHFHLVR